MAVLLDLDDTILVFDALAEEAWRTVSYRFEERLDGQPLTDQDLEDLSDMGV